MSLLDKKDFYELMKLVYDSNDMIIAHDTSWMETMLDKDGLRDKMKEITNCNDKNHPYCILMAKLIIITGEKK